MSYQQPPQGPWQPSWPFSPQDPRQLQHLPPWPQPNTEYPQSSGPQRPPPSPNNDQPPWQGQSPYTQPQSYQQSGQWDAPQYNQPTQGWQPDAPPPFRGKPPKSPKKPFTKRFKIISVGCFVIALLLLCGVIGIFSTANANNGTTAVTPTPTATATPIFVNSQATDTPTTAAPIATATSMPTPTPQVAHYPPTTEADLRGLAAQGDASAIHEFHSESVGLVGACPQPKREVTVDPSLTGKQLAEDLLAYFYGQQLDNPCGSVVFAYHNQAEVDDPNSTGYTAGRILLDVTDSSGQGNVDPNATNLKYTLTLDTGDALTGQEYVVTY